MQVTDEAAKRLEVLRRRAGGRCLGFWLQETIGTCRGSCPVLKPVSEPVPGTVEVSGRGVPFYAAPEYAEVLEEAVLDFDGTFFGRGLVVSWPHREGGCPACR